MKRKEFVLYRIEEPLKEEAKPRAGVSGIRGTDTLIGSRVVSSTGEDIGKLHCIWEDESRQAAFLGVKTGWLGLGKIHVVPAYSAEINRGTNTIRVPFDEETIKNAPTYDADAEMTPQAEHDVYEYYHGYDKRMPEPRAFPTGTSGTRGEARTTREEASIPLHEEEVKVGKRQVEVGGVRLRKIIRKETVQQPVELEREELVVEKVPAREMRPGERAFEAEDIYIPLRAEEPVIEKQTRVTEEVRFRKQPIAEKRTVSETVRKEEVATEKKGDVEKRSI